MKYRNLRYRGGAAAAGISLAAILAACGSASPAASSSTPTTVAPPASAPSASGGSFPGAVGSVASLAGSSMEVQSQQAGQVTVGWTASTTFTQSKTVSASTIAVGSCVVVTGSSSGGTVTARTVSISPPSASGTCTTTRPAGGSFGGRGGANAAGGNGAGGNGAARSGAPISFASGKVTSVSSGTLALYGTAASGGSGSSSSGASSNLTVDLNSSTVFTQTQPATATNLAVGDCVSANGTTDSTGAVSASSVRITSTGGQSCSTGFPGGGRGAANG
jgi:hypothetical protein